MNDSAPSRTYRFGLTAAATMFSNFDGPRMAVLGTTGVLGLIFVLAHAWPLGVIVILIGLGLGMTSVGGLPTTSVIGDRGSFAMRQKVSIASVPTGTMYAKVADPLDVDPIGIGGSGDGGTSLVSGTPARSKHGKKKGGSAPQPKKSKAGKIANLDTLCYHEFQGPFGKLHLAEHDRFGLVVHGGSPSTRSITFGWRTEFSQAFALLPLAEQDQAMETFASVLNSVSNASSAVRRVSWIARQVPSDSSDAEAYVAANLNFERDKDEIEDYLHLLGRLTDAASSHEVYLFLTVVLGRDAKDIVTQAAQDMEVRVHATGVTTHPMSVDDIRRYYHAALRGSAFEDAPTRPLGVAGPLATREGWDHVLFDETYHRSLVVTAWPRQAVQAPWLRPMLTLAVPGASRTVAVHFSPVPRALALRRARTALTSRESKITSKAESGTLVTSEDRRLVDQMRERESLITGGYAEHRIAAIVSLAAPDLASLDRAGKATVYAADSAQLDLRVRCGRQLELAMTSLPGGDFTFAAGWWMA